MTASMTLLLSALAAVASPAAQAADRLIVGFTPTETVSQQVADLRAAGVSTATAASVQARDIPAIDVAQVTVAEGSGPAIAAALRRQSGVEYVEVDARASVSYTPNDPRMPEQWALYTLGAHTAWDTTLGVGVKVAVVDTGVDYTHPDLSARVDLGYDYVRNDADPMDGQGHGTHVAGIIAATENNAEGIAGVAPSARILAVRVLDTDGTGYYSWIANGIIYAADNGAKVINLSLGGDTPSETLRQAVDYASAKGALVTCATGNDGAAAVSYPAAYEGCFAVGATNNADVRANFSNFGVGIDITAPGQEILSTVSGGGYEAWSGTSMATPYVAGVAALLKAQGLNRGQIISTLKSTAADLGASGYDTSYGYGRVDASAAVAFAATLPASPPDAVAPIVSSLLVDAPYVVQEQKLTDTWRRVRVTKWRVVGKSKYGGVYNWQTQKSGATIRRVFQFKLKKGVIRRRSITLRKTTVTIASPATYRNVQVTASDNLGVDRVGLAVDGHWVSTDWIGSDGWSVAWKCTAGTHTFVAYGFDTSDNAATAQAQQTVTC